MFDELAAGVFRRHYDFLSLNVGVVIGGEGVLVIDTRESHEAAAELASDIRTLTEVPGDGWPLSAPEDQGAQCSRN